MQPYFHLFGLEVPAYGVMMVLGGLAAVLLVLTRRKQYPVGRVDAVNLLALCTVGALAGAKALYVLTVLPDIFSHWDRVLANPMGAVSYALGGLVFYGGVLGALGVGAWYIRKYRLDFPASADLFAPAIPAAQAIGRVGCFLGGCCYGVEAAWGFTAHASLAPDANGVPRVPVQLIESVCDLLICLALLWYERRHPKRGRVFAMYLLLYAPVRFVLEFFRGDALRGIAMGVSTSQWISVLLFGVGLVMFQGRRQRTADSGQRTGG
ncbi:MAG: prolipoprotein diacylglyceryl transferase [Oscillospiraceae bacterium]|nr:prolipoprotein diacylglyceryl transferase [Oscillospiraceae bacterium]